jgi:hypothetical protein
MIVHGNDLCGEVSRMPRLLRTPPPYPDESLMGYILRLTEENGYDRPSWIFELAGMRFNVWGGGWYAFYHPGFDPAPLERVIGLRHSEFQALKYGNVPSKRAVIFSDHQLSVDFIRFSAPKMCPACLQEANYYRRFWDLLPLTVCPDHRLMLLDTCPGCSRPLSWSREKMSVCHCGFDWRTSRPVKVDTDGLEVSRHILRLCRQTEEISQTEINRNPLYSLGLDDFCRALNLLAGYYLFIEGGGWVKTKTENYKCHKAYSVALRAFTAWPESFYRYLLRAKQRGGRRICESKLYRQIEMQCDTPSLLFMYIACEDYVEAYEWDALEPGITCPPAFRRFVNRDEACRRLGVDQERLDRVIEKGNLITMSHPISHGMLFDAKSIERLMDVYHLLSLKEVAIILNANRSDTEDLLHEGFLKPLSGPTVDGLPEWRFDRCEIVELIERTGNMVTDCSTGLRNNLIVLRAAIHQMKTRGLGPGSCLRAVLKGEIVTRKEMLVYPYIPNFEFAKDCVPKPEGPLFTELEHVESSRASGKIEQVQPFDYKLGAQALESRRNMNLSMHSRHTVRTISAGPINLEVSDLAYTAREVFSRIAS